MTLRLAEGFVYRVYRITKGWEEERSVSRARARES